MNSDCILCGAKPELVLKDLTDLEYGCTGSFSFKRCPNCGLLMLFPAPTIGELKTYYPDSYHCYHTQERGIISILSGIIYQLRFREYVSLVGKQARILEIGCADMPYLDSIKIKYPDLKITGVEFKEEVAESGRGKGRNIITGTIFDLKQNESYDLIIMNNLIEHVIDPVREVERAYVLLRPGGYLLIETPNLKSWDYAIFKKYWGSLHVPRHTYLFSPDSINLLAEKTKFEVVKVKYLLSTDNWSLSIQNFLQKNKKLRCKINNGRVWYYKFLLFIFIPFCLIQRLFKGTGAFEITLKKKESKLPPAGN